MAASALVLDLDGTVWDSRPWYAALVADGDAARRAAALAKLAGGRAVPAAQLLRQSGVTPARFRKLCSGPERVSLYPGVADALQALHDIERPLGAVTNLPGWMAEPMLACHGLEDLFGSVVTYGRAARPKPDPAPLHLCSEELGIEVNEDVWYVGDSASDCRAANAVGMSFAWAAWGYDDVPPAGADAVLADFDELLGL